MEWPTQHLPSLTIAAILAAIISFGVSLKRFDDRRRQRSFWEKCSVCCSSVMLGSAGAFVGAGLFVERLKEWPILAISAGVISGMAFDFSSRSSVRKMLSLALWIVSKSSGLANQALEQKNESREDSNQDN